MPRTLSGLCLVVAAACAAPLRGPFTTSARAVMLDGDRRTTAVLRTPPCDGDLEFLVQDLHVGPEVEIWDTSTTVIQLQEWAASLPLYPPDASGQRNRVPLTVAGRGPQHLAAHLGAGQPLQNADQPTFPVALTLLGSARAGKRFEFNVHVGGVCGRPGP